jgi:hypothetical protein
VIALLFVLFALLGFSSGSTGSGSVVPAAAAPAPRARLSEPLLAPVKTPSCAEVDVYRARRPLDRVYTHCNVISGAKR